MRALRKHPLAGAAAALALLLLAAFACAITLWLAYRPPFLTWQHGAEMQAPLDAYVQAEFPPGYTAHITWVKEYTETCSVVRATVGPRDLWVLLGRDDGPWEVVFTESDARLVPLLSLADVCGTKDPLIPNIDPDLLR